MSAELLRQAATILRERAKAATPGPWEASLLDGLVWANRLGDPVSGSTLPEDAAYIATVDPDFGKAVADWLDLAARHAQLREDDGAPPHTDRKSTRLNSSH